MQKLFNKILVPVDFSLRSKRAVEKAVELANNYDCSIALLHVVSVSPFAAVALADGHVGVPYPLLDNKKELEFSLKKLAGFISVICNRKLTVTTHVLNGTWDEAVIDFVTLHGIDVVLIGQKGRFFRKRKMLLNPDKIAAKTNIPVITVPANKRITKLSAIVIPITDFLPIRKLMYAIYLSNPANTVIRLLGIKNEKHNEIVDHYQQRALELIQQHSSIKTELDIISSPNTAEAVDNYARITSADLIILTPGVQTRMPGFLSKLLGNIIQKYAAPPVLTVNPI